MEKRADFASDLNEYWPRPEDIEHYFLAPPGQRWFFHKGNDAAYFQAIGVDGTEHIKEGEPGYKEIMFWLMGHPKLGVLLSWLKLDGDKVHRFHSKGDLRRIREHVRMMHGNLLPAGLFIPYEQAWKAVKEFIEHDGALPKSIEWVSEDKLPPNTFPDRFAEDD